MGRRRCLAPIASLTTVVALGACTSGNAPAAHRRSPSTVAIASFDFAESELLAALYGDALRAAGFSVELHLQAGPRELVAPAVAGGLVDFVPEYAGTALRFLTAGTDPDAATRAGVAATHARLVAAADDVGMVALAGAPAQDANAIVVTRATARRYGLRRISDLARVDDRFVFAGPPECATRALCLAGLERTYGLRFREFVPLDTGGPVTEQALRSGDVDVALLFTSAAALRDSSLVVLRDDRHLQPSENITPLVRRTLVDRLGPRFAQTVDAVSQRLTTPELQGLNARYAAAPDDLHRITRGWLAERGLA